MTTMQKLAALLVSRSHELKIVNTVCPVTIRRQEDTLETAREVDLMVVVGGRSSANTMRAGRFERREIQPAAVANGPSAAVITSRESSRSRIE